MQNHGFSDLHTDIQHKVNFPGLLFATSDNCKDLFKMDI